MFISEKGVLQYGNSRNLSNRNIIFVLLQHQVLFDGHDASINIMRRILQASGAEVIHLGHNRSVEEVVNAAIQEDVQGIAMSSYQGGMSNILNICMIYFRKKALRIFAFMAVAAE